MKFAKLALAALMAASLAACSSSDAAATTDTTEAEETAAATVEAEVEETAEAEEEEVVTTGTYTFTNASGVEITELYVYKNDSEDKGENYAADGLADGEELVVEIGPIDEEEAADYHQIVEYVNADGETAVVFETLSLEVANLTLKPVADIESGATPFLD